MSEPGRRELGGAVVAAVAAGAVALSTAGQRWADVTAQRRTPLPPVAGALSGSDAAPLVGAAGLVLLAAGIALLATRGTGRAVVGLAAAAAGGALAWSGARVLTGGVPGAAADLPGLGGGSVTSTAVDVAPAGPVLALLAGVLGVAVGLLVVLRGRRWPAMGRRYERSTAAVPGRSDEERAQDAWQALDRGEDPTEPPPAARSARPV